MIKYWYQDFKYYILHRDDEKMPKQLGHIMIPKMSGYAKSFDKTKYMLFWLKMMNC